MSLESRMRYQVKKVKDLWSSGYVACSSTDFALKAYVSLINEIQSSSSSRDYKKYREIVRENGNKFPYLHEEDAFVRINADMKMQRTFLDMKMVLQEIWVLLGQQLVESTLQPKGLVTPILEFDDIRDDDILFYILEAPCDLRLVNGSRDSFGIKGFPKTPRQLYSLSFDNEGKITTYQRIPIRSMSDNFDIASAFKKRLYHAEGLWKSLQELS
ncbi:MAG: hypothetical protein ABIG93_00850 [archaeon]|nr:hypothetical protein [Nanoarchaeota archaeon]